jgi:hypothetical protein
MATKAFAYATALVSLTACSSGPEAMQQHQNPPPPQYTGDDPATTHPDQCAAKNPNGVCYPTNNIGYAQRSGSTPGSKIPNLRFFGYKNTDPTTKTPSSGDLQQIELADFYDPDATKYRIIRIVPAALWCGPCNEEADFIVQNNIATDLAPEGVVIINAIVEGSVAGVGATPTDLQTWISNHQLNYTGVVDGDFKTGIFWKSPAIPQNITIDARSMEILDRQSGFSTNVKNEILTWVKWTKTYPAQK